MKDGLFEASDFKSLEISTYGAENCASIANALLPALKEQWREEMLRDAQVVYTTFGPAKNLKGPWFTIGRGRYDTHTAKLVDMKEIDNGK